MLKRYYIVLALVLNIAMYSTLCMQLEKKHEVASLKTLCLKPSIDTFFSSCEKSIAPSINAFDKKAILEKATAFFSKVPKDLRELLIRCALQHGSPKKLCHVYTIYALSKNHSQALGVMSDNNKIPVISNNTILKKLSTNSPSSCVMQAAVSADQKKFVITTLDNKMHVYTNNSPDPYATIPIPQPCGSLCFIDKNRIALPVWESIELFNITTHHHEKLIDLKGAEKKIALIDCAARVAATGVYEVFDKQEHIAIIDIATKENLMNIPMIGISSFIKTLAAHQQLPLLAIASAKTGYIYDTNVQTDKPQEKLFHLSGTIEALTFHPTIKQCISITTEFYPTIRLWDLDRKEIVFNMPITNLSSTIKLSFPLISWSSNNDSIIIRSNDGTINIDPRCWIFSYILKKLKKII